MVVSFGGWGGDGEGDSDSCREEQGRGSEAQAAFVDDSLSQSPV